MLFSAIALTINAAASPLDKVVEDISIISKHWANLKPYEDVPTRKFGVKDTGLPEGCQIEQVQILHRHAARYPPSVELPALTAFAAHVAGRTPGESFRGPMKFLNTWSLRISKDSLLPTGVSMAYKSGTDFWNNYGRILYDAVPGQTSYNATGQNIPLVRCNTLPRVSDTAKAWADGFFGQYNATSKYSLLPIPYALNQNNTLASYISCVNFIIPTSGINKALSPLDAIVPLYLVNASRRLSEYAPQSVNLSEHDAFDMQQLCVYEYFSLGSSDFCKLFTLREWKGYEYLLDSYYYNYASFGSVVGRALGIGILKEMLARLEGVFINTSQSSINATLDSNPETFPLNQKIYADFSHDFMIWGILAAMSMDYFRKSLPVTYPPPPNSQRHFRLADVTPYAARFVIEKIGCNSPRPVARHLSVTQYSASQYNYSASTASHKFVRIRLNNAILPLNTIRGGKCKVAGRTDGLCPLTNFLDSQADAERLANYQFICFANYTVDSKRFDGDGTYFP